MTDTLEVFGKEWTNVAGFKACNDNDVILTYIRPQGTLTILENDTGIDVTSYAAVDVNTPSAGWSVDTKTVTASNVPVSLSFTDLSGQPRAFWVKCTGTITSSGSTTYYYIVDILYDGTNHTGNYMQIGNNRRVYSDDTHYSHTYSNGTLTVSSSATSRTQAGGAFSNTTYELVYFY